jgi:hypothetical protein
MINPKKRAELSVQWEPLHILVNFFAYAEYPRNIGGIAQYGVDPFHNLAAILFLKATGGDGRCAYPDARSGHWWLRIERNHVFIDRDIGFPEGMVGNFTRYIF